MKTISHQIHNYPSLLTRQMHHSWTVEISMKPFNTTSSLATKAWTCTHVEGDLSAAWEHQYKIGRQVGLVCNKRTSTQLSEKTQHKHVNKNKTSVYVIRCAKTMNNTKTMMQLRWKLPKFIGVTIAMRWLHVIPLWFELDSTVIWQQFD